MSRGKGSARSEQGRVMGRSGHNSPGEYRGGSGHYLNNAISNSPPATLLFNMHKGQFTMFTLTAVFRSGTMNDPGSILKGGMGRATLVGL